MNVTLQKILIILVSYGVLAGLYSLLFMDDGKSSLVSQTSTNGDIGAPKQRRAFFEHLYEGQTEPPEKTKSSRKSRKKRLNEKKENKMTKEFLDLVTNYAVKFNGFRLVLRDSNPFSQLGFYKDISSAYYANDPGLERDFEKAHYGLINDPSYCEVSDFNNIYDATKIFSKMNVFTDYDSTSRLRTIVLPQFSTDVMPQISMDMNITDATEKKYLLNYATTLFFTKTPDFHFYHEIGKNFLCLHQMYNHIPGNSFLRRTNLLSDLAANYTQSLSKRTCINSRIVFPQTYKLHIKDQCKAFFKELETKSEDYSSYIIRYKYHTKSQKVFELEAKEKLSFINQFGHGLHCGEKKTPIIAQKFSNPKMINATHFIMLRTYMLVSSTNPMIVYYHDGHWIVLPKIEERDIARMKFKTYEDLHERYPQFTFDRMEKILNYKRRQLNVNDTNQDEVKQLIEKEAEEWLDQFVRKDVKHAMAHLANMNEILFLRHSGVFELFALDFIMGEGGRFYLIDAKSSPKTLFKNARISKYYTKLYKDIFEIQYAYLRSRVRRLRTIFPKIHGNIADSRQADFASLKKQFESLNRNKIEPEFAVDQSNGFTLIVDKSFGKSGFFGHIEEECL